MKYLINAFLFFIFPLRLVFSQIAGDVSQLVSLENYLSAQTKQKGAGEAFKKAIDGNSRILQPQGMTDASEFIKSLPPQAVFSWEPVYARIAKSGDWGFTSGPFTF